MKYRKKNQTARPSIMWGRTEISLPIKGGVERIAFSVFFALWRWRCLSFHCLCWALQAWWIRIKPYLKRKTVT